MTFLIIYLVAINLAAFVTFGVDKRKAVRKQWRVRERTLFLLAFLGGGPGAFLGMEVFRHKTKHLQFQIGIPLIAVVEYGLLIFILTR